MSKAKDLIEVLIKETKEGNMVWNKNYQRLVKAVNLYNKNVDSSDVFQDGYETKVGSNIILCVVEQDEVLGQNVFTQKIVYIADSSYQIFSEINPSMIDDDETLIERLYEIIDREGNTETQIFQQLIDEILSDKKNNFKF
jgi:hypothetical protein